MAKKKCVKCGSSSSLLSYHRFPKTPERKVKWIQRLKLTPKKIYHDSRVCTAHFKPCDLNRVHLKTGVVPRKLNYDENGIVRLDTYPTSANSNPLSVQVETVQAYSGTYPSFENIKSQTANRSVFEDSTNNVENRTYSLEKHTVTDKKSMDTTTQTNTFGNKQGFQEPEFLHVKIEVPKSSQLSNGIFGIAPVSKVTNPKSIYLSPFGLDREKNKSADCQEENNRNTNSRQNADTDMLMESKTLSTGLDLTEHNLTRENEETSNEVDNSLQKKRHRKQAHSKETKSSGRLKVLLQQNRRLRKRLTDVTTGTRLENLLQKRFGNSPGFLEIIKSQFQRYDRGSHQHYSSIEKTTCLTIYYSCGRNGYQTLLNLGWKLPALSTIRMWMKEFDLRTGINEELMVCLRQRVQSMAPIERDCVLTWDEVSIKEYVEYNKNTDELDGIFDQGSGKRKLDLATEALVVMIRGINSNWKFPISFYFSNGSATSDSLDIILKENILKITDAGLRIRIGVCDMSFTNQGLYRRWGVTQGSPYAFFEEQKIYMIHDVPHLIKLVRNNLQRRNFLVNGKSVKWYWILRFYQLDCRRTSRHAPRLTKLHFNLRDYSKMKVKLATQVFSRSVYAGMTTFIILKILKKEAKPTADFVKEIDELFDLLNISKYENIKSIKASKNLFQNLHLFDKHYDLIRSIVVPGCKGGRPDCLKGLELSIQGIKSLILDLKSDGYKYVLTRHLQQDCIEHFFSFIRLRGGWNRNPTARQFRYNFRYQFVSHMIKSPNGSNCEHLEHDPLFNNVEKLKSVFKMSKNSTNSKLKSLEKRDRQESFDCFGESRNDIMQNLSLESSMAEQHELPNLMNETDSKFFTVDSKVLKKSPVSQSNNVAAYMSNSVCKRVTQKVNCQECQLMFESSSCWDDEIDLMIVNKAYSSTMLCNKESGYGLKLKELNVRFFCRVFEDFENEIEASLNDDGKSVLQNVTARLLSKRYARSWVNFHEDCVEHRKQMLKKVLLAKIFRLVKDKNEMVKQSKCWTQTRRELRNQ